MVAKHVLVIVIIFCIIFGILSYGIWMGYFEGKYDISNNCRENQGRGISLAIFGPINLFVQYLYSGFAEYGLKFTCEVGE